MISYNTYPYSSDVVDELKRYAEDGALETIEDARSIGNLRGLSGERNLDTLNVGKSRARVQAFGASAVFSDALEWFIKQSDNHFGQYFNTRGYVGLTQPDGILSYIHLDTRMSGRLNIAFAALDEPLEDGSEPTNPSTLFYEGEALPEVQAMVNDKMPMEQVLQKLGSDAFTQAAMGQTASFGTDTYHGEMLLPPGTPKLFLASTSGSH